MINEEVVQSMMFAELQGILNAEGSGGGGDRGAKEMEAAQTQGSATYPQEASHAA